jgi:hypothetical protein
MRFGEPLGRPTGRLPFSKARSGTQSLFAAEGRYIGPASLGDPFPKGKKSNAGRKPGVPNKFTAELKQAFPEEVPVSNSKRYQTAAGPRQKISSFNADHSARFRKSGAIGSDGTLIYLDHFTAGLHGTPGQKRVGTGDLRV